MNILANGLVPISPRLLAVLIVCLMPAALPAETVMFRNECQGIVIVQTATLMKGVLHRDPPSLLFYGECTPNLPLHTDKVVAVYNGKTNYLLFRGALKAGKQPLYFSIVPDPRSSDHVQVISRSGTPLSRQGAQH